MNQKLACPYQDNSGCCTRHGCIYLPHQKCLTIDELKRQIKLKKKMKKGRKKHGK